MSMMSAINQDPFDELEQDDDFLKELQDNLISESEDDDEKVEENFDYLESRDEMVPVTAIDV